MQIVGETRAEASHVHATIGGQPTSDGCGADTLGQRAHMSYRADYVLLVPRTPLATSTRYCDGVLPTQRLKNLLK
jgi:hypothetical protein